MYKILLSLLNIHRESVIRIKYIKKHPLNGVFFVLWINKPNNLDFLWEKSILAARIQDACEVNQVSERSANKMNIACKIPVIVNGPDARQLAALVFDYEWIGLPKPANWDNHYTALTHDGGTRLAEFAKDHNLNVIITNNAGTRLYAKPQKPTLTIAAKAA